MTLPNIKFWELQCYLQKIIIKTVKTVTNIYRYQFIESCYALIIKYQFYNIYQMSDLHWIFQYMYLILVLDINFCLYGINHKIIYVLFNKHT